MSQLFIKKTSRGRAYKYLFYYLACSFRCVDMDALLKHIEPNAYPAHAIKMSKVAAVGTSDKEMLMMSNNPYVLMEVTDYTVLTPQQSEKEWLGRAKAQSGSQLFQITATPTATQTYQQSTPTAIPSSQQPTPTATQTNSIITPGNNMTPTVLNMPSFTIGSYPTTTEFQTLDTNHNTLHTPVIHIRSPPTVTRLPQEEDVLHQIFHGYNPQEPITPIHHSTSLINNSSSLHTPVLQQTVTPTATPSFQQSTPMDTLINNQQAPINTDIQAPDSTIQQAYKNMDNNICKAITSQTTITGLINGTLRTIMSKFEDRERILDEREKRLDEIEARMNERETKERARYERAREENEQQERAKADHERLERARLDYERIERERREEREPNKRKQHDSEIVKQKKKK